MNNDAKDNNSELNLEETQPLQEEDSVLSSLENQSESFDELDEEEVHKDASNLNAIKKSREDLFFQFMHQWILPGYLKHSSKVFERSVSLDDEQLTLGDINNLMDFFDDDASLIALSTQFNCDLIGNVVFVLPRDSLLELANMYTKQSIIDNFNKENKQVFVNLFSEIMTYLSNILTTVLNCPIVFDPIQINTLESKHAIRDVYPPDESEEKGFIWSYSILDNNTTKKLPIYCLFSKNLIDSFYHLFSKMHPVLEGAEDQQQFASVSLDEAEPEVSPVEYQSFKPELQGPSLSGKNISLLLDLSMDLTVELGRSNMKIRDILSLGEGAIIELDKLAGEPVDLLVNSLPIARGEVVVIDENFGVRITDIIGASKRLESIF